LQDKSSAVGPAVRRGPGSPPRVKSSAHTAAAVEEEDPPEGEQDLPYYMFPALNAKKAKKAKNQGKLLKFV
jgi:hypothetical protein